ncbi:MAG: heme A synthase [Bacteroidetes bacterium]|nr:MAG: heme A synthase [Bacteroidota bacterium]
MENLFRKFCITTIVAVYLLILVGSVVRSTASGMGCPDWPKCFGQYIPPTDISQLPADYKTVFAVAGKEIADFDAFKTWVEYLNRLLGVLIGFFIFLTFVFSLLAKNDRKVVYGSFLALLLVGFEGWLGSRVVATNLKPLLITAHMIVALLIVLVLIQVFFKTLNKQFAEISDKYSINKYLLIAFFLSLIQILLGTQVREGVDRMAVLLQESARETWLEEIGIMFYVHRSFSILVLLVNVLFIRQIFKNNLSDLKTSAYALVFFLFIEIASGVIMAYFAIPAVMQPVHLLLASLILGVQYWAILIIKKS